LKTNITDPRRIPSLAAIVNLGQRKETAALSSILRRFGQSPQSRTIKIFP
jgi:Mn-dependent DtxR family transcriptional regulator